MAHTSSYDVPDEDDVDDSGDDQQNEEPAPDPASVPAPIAAACRARLLALRPAAAAAACDALEAVLRGLPVTGSEPIAAAAAAVEAAVASSVGPGAPREVAGMLRVRAALAYGRLQMAAVGERLGQAGKAAADRQLLQQRARWAAEGGLRSGRRRAGGAQQPVWGAAELHMALVAARRAQLVQAVQAAELALAEAQESCAEAHAAQATIVGRLPAADGGDPVAAAEGVVA